MKPAGRTTVRRQLARAKQHLTECRKNNLELQEQVKKLKNDNDFTAARGAAAFGILGFVVFVFFIVLMTDWLDTKPTIDKAISAAQSAAYSSGLEEGKEVGIEEGKATGLEEGRELGRSEGYQDAEEEYGSSYEERYEEGLNDGYDSGHDDGYEEGYEAGIAETESDVQYFLDLLDQPYPESGAVHDATTESRPATLNVTNDTEYAYICKVVSAETNGHYMEFFLRPDSSASITLPLGTYYIYYQKGNGAWYGWNVRFWKSCDTGMFDYYYVSTGGIWDITISKEKSKEIDEDFFQQVQKPAEVITPSRMVWIPKVSGNKYHFIDTCSNMYGPYYVSIEWAKSLGYTACNNCW